MWCIIRSHEVRPQSSTFWLQWSFERLFSWRKELVQPCLQNTYHANQTDPQWKFLVSKAALRFFQTLSSLKCRLTSLLIHRASANVGVAGKLKGLSGKDSSDPSSAVSSTSHVTRRYVWSASTFCQCGFAACRHDCLKFPHFHAPTPTLIALQKSSQWRRITACVHVVCDYCSVTPEANPGAMCRSSARNVSFTRLLHSNLHLVFF